MQHEWVKTPGYKTWRCACGAQKQIRKVQIGAWASRSSIDRAMYSTAEQLIRGVFEYKQPSCTRG